MHNTVNPKSAFLLFLPLLLFYLALVFAFSPDNLLGDQGGYVKIASHIAGLASPQDKNTLWWGPGYPLVLAPFLLLKIPLFYARLLNAIFLFLAVIYFFRTLELWFHGKIVIALAYFYGLYPPLMVQVPHLYTENLEFFLVCGFVFHLCKLLKDSGQPWLQLLLAAAYLGYLALTKVFFGYVLALGIVVYGGAYLFRKNVKCARTAGVYLLALIFCIPYLGYTYSVTNKVFYWGTSGGMSLYWMSTPYTEELGDWFREDVVEQRPELARHLPFFQRISKLPEAKRDEEFKNQAIYNITHYPRKYISNWLANIGRLLFSYPFSYTPQKLSTYFYLLPNMFLVILFILGVYPAVRRWKSIPLELYCLLFLVFMTLGGTSLLSAYDRQFRPMVPILVLWVSYIYLRVLRIEIRPQSEIT